MFISSTGNYLNGQYTTANRVKTMKTYRSGDTTLILDPGINKEMAFKIIHNNAEQDN